jgi:heme/copper-type cytochrome/quinol oxidase subunit 2
MGWASRADVRSTPGPGPVGTVSILFFWVVVALVSVAEAAVIVVALRTRVAHNPARGLVGSRPMEIAWTLLPTALLAWLVVLSYQTWGGAGA